MATSVDTGRKRAFCTTKTLKEEASMEWTINDFAAWAESKDIGSRHLSSTFSFQFDSIKKTYNFSIAIYPRATKENSDFEDQIGLYLYSHDKVCNMMLFSGVQLSYRMLSI
jgi:hypothetical protein